MAGLFAGTNDTSLLVLRPCRWNTVHVTQTTHRGVLYMSRIHPAVEYHGNEIMLFYVFFVHIV